MPHVVVAGHLMVDPEERADYLTGCEEVVRQARSASGCMDFAISPDLLDRGRINVYERWESQSAVEDFRGDGPSDEQSVALTAVAVAEHEVGAERSLG